MTKTTKNILNRWNWSKEDIETLETLGYEGIVEKFEALDDSTYNKLTDYYTDWLLGDKPKARLNYWMKKTGITEPMLNIWCTV